MGNRQGKSTNRNGNNQKGNRLVLWTQLVTPGMDDAAVVAAERVAGRAAALGYNHLVQGYRRTDDARNKAVLALSKVARDDRDVLVMLDADHMHPMDVIEQLVAHDVGVVGAMYFRRGEPFDVCAFRRGPDVPQQEAPQGQAGQAGSTSGLVAVGREETGLHKVAVVGTGAIAIQRWVFERLMEKGYGWPHFRYAYAEGSLDQPTEDMYFGAICEEAGIPHYVDCDLVTPHLRTLVIDRSYAVGWAEARDDEERAGGDGERAATPARTAKPGRARRAPTRDAPTNIMAVEVEAC